MKIIDPGHVFELSVLDKLTPSSDRVGQILTFVKRIGKNYPGNNDAFPGTTLQEILRACISRVHYLNNQKLSNHNRLTIIHLELAIYELEIRAAEQHNRVPPSIHDACCGIQCLYCLHVGCDGSCLSDKMK